MVHLKFFALGIAAVLVSGCAVAWGKPYKVAFANSTNITITYDPALTSLGKVQGVAQTHCDKYARDALPRGVVRAQLGLVEANYSCIRRN